MSVEQFIAQQSQVKIVMKDPPECWVVIANPVYGRAEATVPIAAFDTRELADAYVAASRLPPELLGAHGADDKYSRSFRPDSLLWDFNAQHFTSDEYPSEQLSRRVHNLMFNVTSLRLNPPPPSGPCPPLDKPTDHPQYGVDYDVGFSR